MARTAHLHVVRAEAGRILLVILNWIAQLATLSKAVDASLAARIRVGRVCPVAEFDAKADWDEHVVGEGPGHGDRAVRSVFRDDDCRRR